MGLLPKHDRDPTISLIAYALAAGAPLVAFLATASPHAYWLDAGEFVQAAVQLDIAHPPGHPLAALLAHVLTWLPLGPLPLRVALAQATFAALGSLFLFRAIDVTVRSLEVRHDRIAIPIALAATWCVSLSYAWWFQAVRPEVYALQAMLLMIALERVVTLEAHWPTHDVRPLYVAALALGLGLSNHHFMAVLVLPALAPTMARVYRIRGPRSLLAVGGALAAGLGAYVYLPVRAHTNPPVDLGHPTTLDRFLWVVSARAYQKTGQLSSATPLERLGEVTIAIVESLHPALLVLALAGVWVLLRAPGARRLGWIWVAVALFAIAGRTWLGHTSGNPDALGYLMPALAALAALAAAFVAAVFTQLGASLSRTPGIALTALALGAPALALASIRETPARASLATFHATDDLDERRYRTLPPRAVVLAHLPQTVFRHWELDATEQLRPDVTLVPIPFLGYPGVVDRLIERDPTLSDLLRGYLLEGELRQPDLQSLAAQRPLSLELDLRVPLALYETISPSGTLYYDVFDGGTTDADVREGSTRRAEAIAQTMRSLGPALRDPETRNQLLWIHYCDTLFYTQSGMLDRARESLARALEIQPEARELLALGEALADPRLDGPLDIRPFLVPGAR